MGLLGFMTWAVAASVMAGAYVGGARPFGWRGGEFAEAYGWITLACMATGAALLLSPRGRWRGFGVGLLIDALAGIVVAAAVLLLFFWALSHSGDVILYAP